MNLTHISQPLNEILNRLQHLVEENDKIIKNEEINSNKQHNNLLNEEEVAILLSVPVERLKTLRYRNKGPEFYNMAGVIRYHYDDVMNYLKSVKSR